VWHLLGVNDLRHRYSRSKLGQFWLRAYSTGMFLRLAFAISTSIEPEILITDEMISAGAAAHCNECE
jgi:ABC-type polysaccharide/polyol phosphate transport system ATPase subunit